MFRKVKIMETKKDSILQAIQAESKRHTQAMSVLIGKLKNHILALPDNPLIKRLNANCFTLSSKHIGTNWSVKHHDFKKQYELIVQELEESETSNVFHKLNKIITEEKLNSPKRRINLHPDVISHLRKLADMISN